MPSSVAIVLVNWNGVEDTLACLDSLTRLEGVAWRAIVVDNASAGDDADRIAKAHPEATVIRAPRNLGFAGGCNLGILDALERGDDHVWLLNNDAVITQADALARLVTRLEEDDALAAVGPKIVHHPDTSKAWFVSGAMSLVRGTTWHPGDGARAEGFTGLVESPYVTGCALLAPARAWRDIGLLDDAYFLYYEEVDWAMRARAKGWRLACDRDVEIAHKVSSTTRRASDVHYYYLFKSRLLFMKRWAGWRYRAVFLPFACVHYGAVIAYNAARGRRGRVGNVAAAVRDFFAGRLGARV